MLCITVKFALIFRITVLVLDMRTQQMNDDQFLRRRVLQHFLERLQHVGVVFTRTLRTLLVHVVLLVGLARKYRQHGIAGGHRLLVGDPEGFIPRLFHHVHQRRLCQVQVRVLFIGKGQRLLQDFNGVRTRRNHVIKHGQIRIGFMQCIQLRRGFTRITVQTHAATLGRLANHQH